MTFRIFNASICTALVVLALAAAPSWAFAPKDAMPENPEGSLTLNMSFDDVNGTLENVFTSGKVALFIGLTTVAMTPENAERFTLISGFASRLDVESLAFSMGTKPDKTPFFQIAASLPADTPEELESIAKGATPPGEINALFGKIGASDAGKTIEAEIFYGEKGPFYIIENKVFLTARDNLLLMSLSRNDLEASVKALENGVWTASLKYRDGLL